MKKWMPEWLASNYFKLYTRYQRKDETEQFSDSFTFSDAKETLGASPLIVQKTLWELEHNGFLVKRRNEIDPRSKQYQLVSFDSITQVLGIYFQFKSKGFSKLSLEKKIAISNWRHLVKGSTAVYYYDHYQEPGRVLELSVMPEDYGKFIALLTDSETVVNPMIMAETPRAKRYVKLSQLQPDVETIKSPEGLLIEKIEFLLNDLIAESTLQSIMQSIELIAVNSKKIDWSKAIQVIKKHGFIPQLELIVDIINHESKNPVVSEPVQKLINESKADQPNYWGESFPRNDKDGIPSAIDKLIELGPLLSRKEKMELTENYGRAYIHYQNFKQHGFNTRITKLQVRKILDDVGVELNV